ncbi:AmpG family muropeptide MFS transporter [Candidatus Cytomitobacter indipagum]|uniref:AmpG family muropeptide MFS transporter n=1 Tax=Candidatus Cytomitobacter indipagum TaxID=2601575 RepID=A0A5C0UDL6_9PROT|nr:MFS transporter [Candidatus Cytomitobacter indipagum]QEK37849.1 AmpG family muropeptide MFS transporter [Candidatus Cytomitobacter indipagum]
MFEKFLKRYKLYKNSEHYLRNNIILALGAVSAAVYALCFHTLIYWLADLEVSAKSLGFVSLGYVVSALKIFWIPIFEKFDVPYLKNFLDRRASWIFLCIFISGILISIVSFLHPLQDTYYFATCIALSFCCFNIMDTLLRAQILKLATDDKDQTTIVGLGAFGFRTSMYVCINIYYLLYAQFGISWESIYRTSGILIIFTSFLLFLLPKVTELSKVKSFKELLVVPYQAFLQKHRKYIVSLIGFMVFFRLQDRLIAPVFYKFITSLKPVSVFSFIPDIGIRTIFSSYKFISGPVMAVSLLFSVRFLRKHSYRSNAITSVIIHSLSCLPLVFLSMQKNHMALFIILTLFIEKIARSFASNVYYMYQAKFCDKEHAAGQIAMLTLIESVAGAILGISSGYIAHYLNWTALFIVATFISLPVLFFIRGLPKDLNDALGSKAASKK